jgi:hypothetical protein
MQTSRSSTSTALTIFSAAPRARLNWNEKIVIDEKYISQLLTEVQQNFPENRLNFYDGNYPAEDLKSLCFTSNQLQLSKNYNPLQLPLIRALSIMSAFFKEHSIVDQQNMFGQSHQITRQEAAVCYLNFLREYSLVYITYLQAINGEQQALKLLIESFTTDKLFIASDVRKAVINQQDKPKFLLAILTQLTFKILFFEGNIITTIARVRALEIIIDNFNITEVAKAFSRFAGKDYDLCSIFENTKVFNLIPKALVTEASETGTQPHNKLFFKNKTIKKIFKIPDDENFPTKNNLPMAISEIVSHYQGHAIHILHSTLRCQGLWTEEFTFVFTAMFQLAKLDDIQKEAMFGDNAAYRHGGENKMDESAQSGWVLGLTSFGSYLDEDELNQLGDEQLRIRVRQQAYRIYQLESALLKAQKDGILNGLNFQNDPKDYLKRLLMPADLADEEFEETLKQHYRVLARDYHPDSQAGTGHHELFTQLQEAYEFLSNRMNRRDYLGLRRPGDRKSPSF